MIKAITAAVVLLAAVAPTLLADEGRIPVFTPGAVLAAPGRYFVTTNLSVAAGSVITISSDNVDLDLNGFTLRSTAAAPAVSVTGFQGINIHNGTITGGSANIAVSGGVRVVIEDIQSSAATGLPGGKGPVPNGGIYLLNTTEFAIRRVTVRDAVGPGIVSEATLVLSTSGVIEKNLVQRCAGGIYHVAFIPGAGPAALSILGNNIQIADGWGILMTQGTGVLISENAIDGPGVATGEGGILLNNVPRSKLYNNIVSQAGGVGIILQVGSDDSLVLNNVVGASVTAGLQVFSLRNHIEGNVLNGNTSFGLIFESGGNNNVYRRNTARGNAGPGPIVCGGFTCSPDLCDEAVGNSSAGDNFLPGPPAFPGCV